MSQVIGFISGIAFAGVFALIFLYLWLQELSDHTKTLKEFTSYIGAWTELLSSMEKDYRQIFHEYARDTDNPVIYAKIEVYKYITEQLDEIFRRHHREYP